VKVAAELANAASGYPLYTREYTGNRVAKNGCGLGTISSYPSIHTGRHGNVAISRGARKESNFGFKELSGNILQYLVA
jgi:hypothetical protein